ncbi:MAG TPA: UDP-N-acetylmuramoyl-tripeptide--D-alanyl-D-alanine ligase [Polyangia bacterium]|nr:UDP-N-acetylmuramoyl-tripeptide--D-alanyl-D-alanine ligase [Polyangia bacterium]
MSAARRGLESAARAMRGTVLQPGTRGATFAGAAADSRAVTAGQLFFALPGERVDGFEFVAQAANAGAAGVVVARGRGLPANCAEVAVIAVDDPRRALGDLARAVRDGFTGRVVAVTGSNGKTTTKELCAAALRPLGASLRTPGNFNTDVGLPLTILSADGEEAVWVLEMAMRARGEIAYLTEIARPAIGVITNVAAAHLETLGSLEEVARAKGELFAGLGAGAFAVLPADDPLIMAQAAPVAPERRITFGARAVGDVRLLDVVPAGAAGAVVRYAVDGIPVVVRLPLGGVHNARNGAAALAVAFAAGVSARAAATELETVALPPHRSAALPAGGRTILDDCYNANPASMGAALAGLAASAPEGHAFAILGDMLELGPEAETHHRALGRAAGARVAGLAAVGRFAAATIDGAREAGLTAARAVVATSPEDAAATVAPWTSPGDWILIKASRGIRLERAVDALRATLALSLEGPP